jgi:hypothetical protein
MPSAKQCERKRTSSTCEAEPHVSVAKRSKSKANSRRKAKESEKQIKITRKNIVESEEAGSASETGNVNEGDMSAKTDESKGKTLLEILELEMRARAIRALLKQQIGPGDGEDVEPCEGDSETSPSELRKSPSLSTVKDAVSSYNNWSSEDNAAGSNSFDISPKYVRQKLKHKGMENVSLNQCTVDAEHTNNSYSIMSPKPSLDINAIPQFHSAQNSELCSPTKTDPTLDIKHSEFNKNVDQVANEESSQSSSCNSIKSEVIHGDKTQGTESVKLGLPLQSDSKEQKSGSYVAECKATDKAINMAVTPDEPNKEDGELSNDDKSSESVLEIQSDRGCNDIIILDDSDDELLELYTSNKLQKTLVQQTDNSQKLSLENPHEQDNFSNDGSASIEIRGTSNTALRECNVKSHKSLVSYGASGSTTENLAQTEKNEFLSSCTDTEVNEHYRSESRNTTDCSWATRWLQSKDVQKVVSTSKMCAKIRKRMKFAQKGKKVISLTRDPERSCKSSVVIVGSVNEYNMLDKPKSGNGDTPEDTSKSSE